ncbi:LysR family transcriptional regulator [Pseudomonas fragi]|uniref:LysR family transcriptional regulator n=1 Tax=Pseudomonas TaxID=286 RepID=UPI001472D31D|nr:MULTISPECIES: LysR family transcriptional regulator [Pseudomonas]MBM1202048.1 LysR family transcriptional regulator [Pseudomonas fragi]MEC4167715.1 LysR family transcriptional regulator [Pseudomonas sp. MS-1(2024)]NNB18046.1 LysR family transcriptional regulator [Pseudomonas fragi]NNB22892.1 LysR family transcriptional regulator [Pseudomonas fragi]
MIDSVDELRLFIAVYESGSLRGASDRLRLTPAGASKRLLTLENRLGRRLFNRTTRKLSPTTDGEILYRYAQKILISVNDAEKLFLNRTELEGHLRITASATFVQSYLSPVVSEFLRAYPKVTMDIIPTDQVVDLAKSGIDLAIRHGFLADSTLIARKIASSRRVICASPEYLVKHGLPQKPNDLLALDGVIVGKDSNWTISKEGINHSLKINNRFSSSLGEVVRQMALAGHGIALLMDWHVRDDLEKGTLVETLSDWIVEPPVGVYAVYSSRENVSPAVEVFIDHLQEWLAEYPL